jgi:hypothetical protein
MRKNTRLFVFAAVVVTLAASGCAQPETAVGSGTLTDGEIDNIVRRSYQYIAMYNVIQKNAMQLRDRTGSDGWNICVADTELKDHTFQAIARPNNDTLYTGCMLDLRAEPMIIEYPAFDSKYAVLETSAYDHYCEIPLSTTFGDFRAPSTILYYTARTQGYSGEPVEGVDRVMELSGDFAIAFLRVMPHATEPERMERNIATMQEVKAQSLSEYLGEEPAPAAPVDFPAVGTDLEIFGNNFLEVMQFVLDHTTFDADDEMDRQVLEAFKPLGLAPQTAIDANAAATYDGQRSADAAGKVAAEVMAMVTSGESVKMTEDLFKPKGEMSLEPMVLQSVTGPIGVPADQAVYVAMVTSDGEPMNALNDYVIRMSAEELPPAEAFWSVTLYDLENGFFIPNDRKKYSVGENAGMNLDKEGGIEIHIAAEQPAGVPDENWLPLNRGDYEIDAIMRIYAPDLERFATWTAPTAERM